MGGNDNKKQQQVVLPTRRGGTDPRGQAMNRIDEGTERVRSQIDPFLKQTAFDYGRASESGYANREDIYNSLRDIGSGGGSSVGGSSGGGGGGGGGGGSVPKAHASLISAPSIEAQTISYTDPFASYAGFQDFSQTGGYTPADIANMRARGVSPVRAVYANAIREVQRQRGLQGGYSPNAVAAQARMAREQSQATADAVQGVEAGIASERQQGRLAGLAGMSSIEGQRLQAEIDANKFNATAKMETDRFNAEKAMAAAQANQAARMQAAGINAASANAAAARHAANANAAAARAQAARSASVAARLDAEELKIRLMGTEDAYTDQFGRQYNTALQTSANFELGGMGREIQAQELPGRFDTTMGRIQQGANAAASLAYPIREGLRRRP